MKNVISALLLSLCVSISAFAAGENTQTNATTQKKVATTGKISTVQHITSAEFTEKIWDYRVDKEKVVYKGKLPCLVDFYATWCGPCRRISPIMDELAQEFAGKLIIYKVDTDASPDLSYIFSIRSIPTLIFFPTDGTQPVMTQGATTKEDYIRMINEVLFKAK